ncbi:MAG: hypothetical protein LBU33_02165 [Endomicrobium sp.]|jgi:hypothetical protein|nr:hypothetical protein [Endomicrobium sp.]
MEKQQEDIVLEKVREMSQKLFEALTEAGLGIMEETKTTCMVIPKSMQRILELCFILFWLTACK